MPYIDQVLMWTAERTSDPVDKPSAFGEWLRDVVKVNYGLEAMGAVAAVLRCRVRRRMDTFDLGRLTDHDFELVCRDLLGALLGVAFEVFPRGRDGGIDLRHLSWVRGTRPSIGRGGDDQQRRDRRDEQAGGDHVQ